MSELTFAEYAEIQAVNWTTLKEMRKSPAHYHWRVEHPLADTPRLAVGRAAHTAVLEPDRFPLEYVVFDGARRAGKAWDEFAAVNAARTILRRDEYELCLAVRDAVRGNPDAAALLTSGRAEVPLTWTDKTTGLACKCRVDWVGEAHVELKTTASIDARIFGNLSARMGYHCQVAMQRMGLLACDLDIPSYLVAVEAEPPYDIGVFELDDDTLYAGEEEVYELLRRVDECTKKDHWPGRYEGTRKLQLPAWIFAGEESEYEIMGLVPAKGRAA